LRPGVRQKWKRGLSSSRFSSAIQGRLVRDWSVGDTGPGRVQSRPSDAASARPKFQWSPPRRSDQIVVLILPGMAMDFWESGRGRWPRCNWQGGDGGGEGEGGGGGRGCLGRLSVKLPHRQMLENAFERGMV
jgi:hypothetical protein